MISIEEIKKKALNFYKPLLQASVNGDQFFPKIVRGNKIPSKNFGEMNKELTSLISGSKSSKGYGYSISFTKKRTQLHTSQDMPESITFSSLDDYLLFTNKVREYQAFMKNVQYILSEFPVLKQWILSNTNLVITNKDHWKDLIAICHWFNDNHEPDKYYIRELPISVHTKFIESKKSVIRSLLDHVIEREVTNEPDFEKHFGLKSITARVRIRFLDAALNVEGRFSDLSLSLDEFIKADFNCSSVFITENQINFLTLPPVKNAIAIWGSGFAVSNIKDINWLKNKEMYYWGDIDVQGFEILSQLREDYPYTKSLMMDIEHYDLFSKYHSKGKRSRRGLINMLTEQEMNVYNVVKASDGRLEQEKIPQSYVLQFFSKITT